MILITADQLKAIVPTLTKERAFELASTINCVCSSYGFKTKEQLKPFLATIIHESGSFTIKQENMNYTTPARLVAVWPSRFNLTGAGGKLNANNYVRNPRKLANAVYNGRMGNRMGTDDGYIYRGGGYMQMTGREDYLKYAAYKKVDVEEAANKIHTDDEWALDSACWEYVVVKKLLGNQNFLAVTKAVNGGTIGLADRQNWLNRVSKNLV